MSDLCLNRGFKVVGGAEMIAPHSIDKRFGAGRPDASDIAALNKFLSSLTAKQELTPVAMPGKRPYKEYKGIPVYPTSSSKCSGCGTCAQECPTEAIDPGDPQHTDKSKCISCMALREHVPVLPAPRPQGNAACRLRRAHQNVRRTQGTEILSVSSTYQNSRGLTAAAVWFSL